MFPDCPSLLFVRIVQMFPVEHLPVLLDKEGVDPEKESTVIISNWNSRGGAMKHEFAVPEYVIGQMSVT